MDAEGKLRLFASQMHLEPQLFAMEKVFILAPSFRAEKSRTRKHLTEFWHLEAEEAWCDHECNLKRQEELVSHMCHSVAKNRVLELDEEYAPAHHMLGRMYEELPWFLGGDQEDAGEHLKKAIFLDGFYAPARLDLGKWYLKHGRSQEAAKEFLRVLKTPPLKKRWIWESIHRPQAQNLLRQIHVSESPGPPG